MHDLTGDDLVALVRRVFVPRPEDSGLGILVDLPDAAVPDHPAWQARRMMAAGWADALQAHAATLGLSTHLLLYRNVRSNNGDLPPEGAWVHAGGPLPATADDLTSPQLSWADVFTQHSILLAPTQFSATAPLKVAARTFPIRAATMPGFRAEMIPALRLDYGEVNRQVEALAARLTNADGAELVWRHPAGTSRLHVDLRYRTAHASGGLLREPGMAGNLPSGEAYIVPYEGERPGEPSRTEGEVPVEFDGEVVRYGVRGNRAVAVAPGGARASAEAERLRVEPAYGNIAELGLGVLAGFGVQPVGEILLDEKLGLHVAFGRSDHFGGQVGPSAFSSPEAVVHIDRVYVPACQPQIQVAQVDLIAGDGTRTTLIQDDAWVVE